MTRDELTIPGETYRAVVPGLAATCRLHHLPAYSTLYYPRYTRLGRRIAVGAPDPARAALADRIRQECGLPHGWPVYFVGV